MQNNHANAMPLASRAQPKRHSAVHCGAGGRCDHFVVPDWPDRLHHGRQAETGHTWDVQSIEAGDEWGPTDPWADVEAAAGRETDMNEAVFEWNRRICFLNRASQVFFDSGRNHLIEIRPVLQKFS